MKKSKYSEQQIITLLKEVELGAKVGETCRKYGFSEPTYSTYGGMDASQLKQLRELQAENSRLKKMYAELALVHNALQDVVAKKLYVFSYNNHRVETMNNNGWQRPRKKAGLSDLHIHDLRHTVGMRLREAGVREETISDVLWHTRRGMTAHYSVAQIEELLEAMERITDERSRVNRSLDMIRRERGQKQPPREVPMQIKTG